MQRLRRGIGTVRSAVALVGSAGRRELTVVMVLTVVASAFTAVELLVGRHLVGALSGDDAVSLRSLTPWLIALGGTLIGRSLIGSATSELRLLLDSLVHRRAIEELLGATVAADLEDFDDPEFHDQIERARSHSDEYAWEVVWGLVSLATTTFSAIAVGGVLLSISPLLVLVGVIAYLPIGFVGVRNTKAMYALQYELTGLDRDLAYHQRLLTSRVDAKEVRAFGLGGWLRERHRTLSDERIAHTRRVIRKRLARSLASNAVTAAVLVLALAQVVRLVVDGRITLADGAAAVVGLQLLAGRMQDLGDSITSLFEGVTFLRDFETFVVAARERSRARRTATAAAPVPVPARPQEISLAGVAYRYPAGTVPALDGIDLTLRAGQVIAIVGPNGSGKSTLAKLLCGLLEPDAGRITWDGVDLAGCDPADVRRHVAPVFQDFTRFEHTVREAIGFGDLARLDDADAVRIAAEEAGVVEIVEGLPHGYDTRLSTAFEHGSELSVGQWQRIAIARAFMRDAPLVVLDEPAASLDPRAERDLFERLHALGRGRTVVFISHRFATVRRADLIVVLLDGHVVERGTHDELMAHGKVYAELYSIQAQQFG